MKNHQSIIREAIINFWRAQGERAKKIDSAENYRKNQINNLEEKNSNRKKIIDEQLGKQVSANKMIKDLITFEGINYIPPDKYQEFDYKQDPERELINKAKSLDDLKSKLIQSSKTLQQSQEEEQRRKNNRKIFVIFLSIILLILLFTVWIPDFIKQSALRKNYKAGISEIENQNWESARIYFQKIINSDFNYMDTKELLKETYYQPAHQAYLNEDWNTACKLGLLSDSDYKDSKNILLESCYNSAKEKQDQDFQGACDQIMLVDKNFKDTKSILLDTCYLTAKRFINIKEWEAAKEYLVRVLDIRPNYLDTKELLLNVILEGNPVKELSYNLKGYEQNVDSPNTYMLLDSLVLDNEGSIKLNLDIVIESGNGAKIHKPSTVIVYFSSQIIKAAVWDGIFDNESEINELYLSNNDVKSEGSIKFDNVFLNFAFTGCFNFQYGKYYEIENICIY